MTSGSKDRSAETHAFSLTYPMGRGKCLGVVTSESRAFTLIELLIVVAIIAILAAIAVPNFLEAQTRAKVARVTADMRTMETGIETYRVDNNKVPVRHSNYDVANGTPDYVPDADTKISDPANSNARVGLKMITTPISYLANIPPDVFNTPIREVLDTYPGTSMALDYWDEEQVKAFRGNYSFRNQPGKQGFALLSVGPDKYIGLNRPGRKYPTESGIAIRNTIRFFYDPTNGTSSYGNVYRFSAGLQQSDLFQ